MCKKGLWWWKCRHYFEWTQKCDHPDRCTVDISPPRFLEGDCSPACCQEDVNEKLAQVKAFELKHNIVPGSSPERFLKPDPKHKAEREQLLQEWKCIDFKGCLAFHTGNCCTLHKGGNMLSNTRKNDKGWTAHFPAPFDLPQKYRHYISYGSRMLNSWEKSEMFKKDYDGYNEAQTRSQTQRIPPPKIPPDSEPRASGSGAYYEAHRRMVDEAVRRRAAEDERHAEEAALMRAEYPPSEQPLRLDRPLDARSTPVPSRQSSVAPEELETIILNEAALERMSRAFQLRAENFNGSENDASLTRRELLQLLAHLENTELFGPIPAFHIVDYIVQERILDQLWTRTADLAQRLMTFRSENGTWPTHLDGLFDLCNQNYNWLAASLESLHLWLGSDATDAQIQEWYSYQMSEPLFLQARENQRAAMEALEARSRSPEGSMGRLSLSERENRSSPRRSGSADSRDSQGNPKHTSRPSGRGKEPMAQNIGSRPGNVPSGTNVPAPATTRAGSGNVKPVSTEGERRRARQDSTPVSEASSGDKPKDKRHKPDDKGKGKGPSKA